MDPITAFLINLIITVVLSVASTLLKQAFAPKQDKRTGSRGSAQVGGKVPQYFLVGTVGEAGKLEYQNAWGNDGEVPNAYLTNVHSFGDLPVAGMVGLFVNGVRVTLSETGAVPQGYPVPEYSGNLWWKFFSGAQTAADSYLVDKFGGDADRAWASDMVGRGVPYLITTALWSETLWTGFPSFMGEFQGIKLYDPRKDTTAGGSGSQRWDDPSTWAFSDNSMVIVYNIERGISYDGAKVWGGSATAAQMPYDVWATAMDACDEAVSLEAGGTEKRFRAGRRISLNERPADVIKEFLIGANARISHAADGTIYVLVGVPDEADGAFTDADVLGSEPLGSIPFPNLDSIINGATATYREPSQAWEDKETAPYYRSDLEAEDDGRRQVEGLDLGTTFSGTQAQRVIKAVIEEGRRFITHVVALPPEFAQFRPLQVLAWTSARKDYSAKMFLITARTLTPWGQVVFGLQEIDPADHNWTPSTDEQPLSFAPVVTNRPAPQEVSGFYVEPAVVVDSTGAGRRPAIDAFWSAASVGVDVRAVRITIRLEADESLVWEGEAPRPELGGARLTEGLLPNEDYEVQIQYVPNSGRITVESSWLPVTTPNVKLGPLDVVYGDIDLDELGSQVEGYFDWMGKSIRELAEQAQAQALITGDQELANAMQFDEMRRSLSVVTGDLSASFDETITTAIVPMQGELVAIADSLTELSAADAGDVSSARIRFSAMTGPAGYGRIGIETRFDNGNPDDYRLAGSYWDTPNDPDLPTRRVEIAEQFVIANSPASAAFQPFIFEGGNLRVANAFVGTASIQDAAITSAKIGTAQITSAKIADGQITNAKIADAQITTAKIGTAQIDTLRLADGAVTVSLSDSAPDGNVASGTPINAQVVFSSYVSGSILVSAQVNLPPQSYFDGGPLMKLFLYRNGVVVREREVPYVREGDNYIIGQGYMEFSYVDIPASAGSYTYLLRLQIISSGVLTKSFSSFRIVGAYSKK